MQRTGGLPPRDRDEDALKTKGDGPARDATRRELAEPIASANDPFAVADDLPALCWAADVGGRLFWFNRGWYEYTGETSSGEIASRWEAALDPRIRPLVMERWAQSIASGNTFDMTLPLRGADGRYRTFLTRAKPKRDEHGVIFRWYGTSVDISAQAEAEIALRESEARFRTFAEAMPNHVWSAKPDGDLDWFNSRVYAYSGATPGQLDGTGWVAIVHPDDVDVAGRKWQAALSSGEVYEIEFRLRRHDGIYRWFIARAVPTRDETGALVQWIGTNTDIDDQKRVSQAQRESERRLILSQNAARIASLELDIETGTVIGSENFWDIWGLSRRQSVHISVLEQIVLPDDKDVRSTPETRQHGTAARDVEYRIRRPDTGAIRWLSRSIDFVDDETGKPIKMFGVIQDITDRKAIEISIRESEERYRSALTVGRMGSWETNFVTRVRIWSPEGQALFGLDLKDGLGCVGGSNDEYVLAIHPDDRHLVKTFHDLCNEVDTFPADYRVVHTDGTVRWLSGRGQVFSRTPDGKCERLVSVMADVTTKRKSEEHVRFLMREMSHRSKNLLAIIQSIARQTMRNAGSMAEFQNKFGDRLRGLAASHDILVDQNWQGADIAGLVRRHLTPFIDAGSPRLELSGPAIDVSATAAQAIGLALHELATNAVKYGALSTSTGKVVVDWGFEPLDDGRPGFRLGWREVGGPPVTAPTRRGFGNEVIGRLVPTSLSGTIEIDYQPAGLRLVLRVPASSIALTTDPQF